MPLFLDLPRFDPFLTAADWEKAGGELGIRDRFERFHTHWALKEVDLEQVLSTRGIKLPGFSGRPHIDIETHHFDVELVHQSSPDIWGAKYIFTDSSPSL